MNVHEHRALEHPEPGEEAPRTEERKADPGPRTSEAAGDRQSGRLIGAARIIARIVLPLLVLAAGYGGYRYFVATRPEPPRKPNVERAFNVRTATISKSDIQPTIVLYGNTVAGREVDMRALVSGRITETAEALREGGRISRDETILKIDPLDYETGLRETEAQLAEAKSKIKEFKASQAMAEASMAYARQQTALAQTDLERAEPLVARGATSQKTVDDRRQVVLQRSQAADQLKNEIDVWGARIAQQEAVAERLEATLRQARQRLAETELKAPFDAYVNDVSAQVGRMVGVNDKVATLIDRDWIDVRFTLTDEQFGRIVSSDGSLEGREVEVVWSLGQSSFIYDAMVERVGSRISAASGGVEVFARVRSPLEPQPLRPGAFVTVKVPDATFRDVVALPATALYEGDKVYLVKDSRLIGRNVQVLGAEGNRLLVRGDLKDGEQVVTSRVSTPGDGVLVKPVDAQ